MEMTLNEAIQHLDETLGDTSRTWECEECRKEHEQLREWLIELSELRKSREPMKPVREKRKGGYYRCAKCNALVDKLFGGDKYCTKCGQAVKWDE